MQLFLSYITKHQLFTQQHHLLVACSGGLDSSVLCHLLHQHGFHFSIAHCNFQLRGEESERDEIFVRSLGEKYKAEIFVKKFETAGYATAKKISIQVAARELRYDWFHELLALSDSRFTTHDSRLLTAHHADDNIETVLMNFFKGTGIGGLHGILPKKGKIIRPLLFAKRGDLRQYAQAEQLQWVEDSSNASDKYTRNFFRHQVVPIITQVIPNAADNILANIERMKEVEMIYTQAIEGHKKKLLEHKGNEVHIPVLKLAKLQPLNTILYELIKDYGFSPQQMPDAIALLQSETGRFVASGTHRIIKNRNWLITAPIQATEAINVLVEEKDEKIVLQDCEIIFERIVFDSSLPIEKSPNIALLDAKQVKFPLLLRKWKAGDYFYPLGMPKKKKVAKFLIDQKLSKTEKEKIWVVESEKKIVWVVGQRIDDRCKVKESTTNVIRVVLKRNV